MQVVHHVIAAFVASEYGPTGAVFLTYDEQRGFADHVSLRQPAGHVATIDDAQQQACTSWYPPMN